MSAQPATSATPPIAERVTAIEGARVAESLDAQGFAALEGLLTPSECDALSGLYSDDRLFRSRIVMGRHGFGRGEYQ